MKLDVSLHAGAEDDVEAGGVEGLERLRRGVNLRAEDQERARPVVSWTGRRSEHLRQIGARERRAPRGDEDRVRCGMVPRGTPPAAWARRGRTDANVVPAVAKAPTERHRMRGVEGDKFEV